MKKLAFIILLLIVPKMLFLESLPLIENTIEARCMVCRYRFTMVNLHPYFCGGSFGYICDECRKKVSKGKEDQKNSSPKIPWNREGDQSYEESKAALEYALLWEKEFGSSHTRKFTVGNYIITFPMGYTAAGTFQKKNSQEKKIFKFPKDSRGKILAIQNIQGLSDDTFFVSTEGDKFFKYDVEKGCYFELIGCQLTKALLSVDTHADAVLPDSPTIQSALQGLKDAQGRLHESSIV